MLDGLFTRSTNIQGWKTYSYKFLFHFICDIVELSKDVDALHQQDFVEGAQRCSCL